MSLSKGSYKHLKQWSEGATTRHPIAVKRGPHQEDEQRNRHYDCKNDVGDAPVDMLLDIDNEGDTKEKAST